MEDIKEKLASLMLTTFGIDLYPKADGRIEIPKYVITTAGWDSADMVYMSSDMCGNLYVSTDSELVEDEVSVAVAISHGRLRIPAGFLKRIGLHNKHLVGTHDLNSTLLLRADNGENEEALESFLDELDDSQTAHLLHILTGVKVEVDTGNSIPNMEIARVSANHKAIPEAKLFLLEGDEKRPVVFRPVGNPYKFKCCWVDKEPHLARDGDEHTMVLYAIPGVKRTKKENGSAVPGFLIVDQTTFGKVCYIVKKKGGTTAIGKDLIFIFSPKTRLGSFKVFENPYEHLDLDIVREAKLACANPERFLAQNFKFYESGDCGQPPTTLTLNTMGKLNEAK